MWDGEGRCLVDGVEWSDGDLVSLQTLRGGDGMMERGGGARVGDYLVFSLT